MTSAPRFVLEPIGFVRGGRAETVDDAWGPSKAAIELADGYDAEAFLGLDAFSHVEIVFVFDQVRDEEIVRGARHPRGRTDWPRVGIFAQRGKNRPNRLGVTVCRALRVSGRKLFVEGLDAVDGTPVVDVKPVLSGFLPREEVREPAWAREIMKDYW